MSIQPAIYNISIQRRADYDLQLQLKDSNAVAIDLTACTVYAQIWDKQRTVKYADFSIVYVNRLLGQFKIVLTDVQTATLPDEAFYDVLVEDSLAIRNYYLEGAVYVSEGYTSVAA